MGECCRTCCRTCCRNFNAGMERRFGKYELLRYPNKSDERGTIRAIWKAKGVTGRKVVLYDDGSVLINDTRYLRGEEALSEVNKSQRLDALLKKFPEQYDYILNTFQPFLFWNFVAAFVHLVNAVASFFGANENQRTNYYPMYQGFTGWTPQDTFCKLANFTCPAAGDEIKCIRTEGYVRSRVDEDTMMAIQPSLTEKRYDLSLFWLIISFHLLSAVFQFTAGLCFKNFYAKHVLENGVNSFRFIEYSISATLMLLCIALIGSIQDVYAHIGLGVLCTATMLFGLIAEVLFSDEFLSESLEKAKIKSIDTDGELNLKQDLPLSLFRRPRFNNELGNIYKEDLKGNTLEPLLKLVHTPEDDCSGVEEKVRQLGWFAHICGWITMAGAYGGIILNHYFWSVERATAANENFEGPPEWITALVFTIMALYQIFGFTQLFQMCAKDPCCYSFQTGRGCCRKDDRGLKKKRAKSCCFDLVETRSSGDGKRIKCNCCGEMLPLNEGIELFYVLNSLVTKTILGWVIISQLLVLDFKVKETIDCKP